MLTGEIRNQIDTIWNAFWSGGISNPLEVIEQITYLLFLRRLDDLHTLEENKATRLKKPIERRIFPEGKDAKGRAYDDLRWSRFKNFEAKEMFEVVDLHVFPFLKTLGNDGSTYAHHMKDARFTIPTPALLSKVVDLLEKIPMEDRDTKGDLYEYMLGKIASAGQNGQFRTPRHIIQLMVELAAPQPEDVICDPACGTAGFLVIVPDGVLFGSSNAHKTLRQMIVEEQKLDAVISLPGGVFKPYAGVSTAILIFTKTNSGGTDFVWFYDVEADGWSLDDKRTPLLPEDKLGVTPSFSASSVIPSLSVPSSSAKAGIQNQQLSILDATPRPSATPTLTPEEHAKNNLPDILARWKKRGDAERQRPRTAQSFCVPKAEIAAQGYDLSLNRYKEVVHEQVEHLAPSEIFANLTKIEAEIQSGMKELQGMLR